MGYVAGKLLGEPIQKAEILLYGSFLATGEGHGTRKAIVAGLLGMQTDDYQIADSYEIAAQRGMEVAFGEARLEEAHPNTAVICLNGISGKQTEVQISSIGGSRISIDKIDDFEKYNERWCLKYKNNPQYIQFLMQAIMEYKDEIFMYIQNYYRYFMKMKSVSEFPQFNI